MSKEISIFQPVDPETAKAVQDIAKLGTKALDSAEKAGGYASGVLGRLPHDLVGMFGDYVHHVRQRRWAELERQTLEILVKRGRREEAVDPSPSIAIPIVDAAINETREELKAIWAALLAAAMDPDRSGYVRQSLITAVKQLDPLDAIILREVTINGNARWTPNGRDALTQKFGVAMEDVLVSFNNLERLELVAFEGAGAKINPIAAPLALLLTKAIKD